MKLLQTFTLLVAQDLQHVSLPRVLPVHVLANWIKSDYLYLFLFVVRSPRCEISMLSMATMKGLE